MSKNLPMFIVIVVAIVAGMAVQFIGFRPGFEMPSLPSLPPIVSGPVEEAPIPHPRPIPKPGNPSKPVSPKPPVKVDHYYVQFASFQTKKEAVDAVNYGQKNFASQLDGRKLLVFKVNIKGKTWYRVVLEMPSKKEADDLCSLVKSKGYNCLSLTIPS